MVTKMVANTRPRVDIERDGSARAADFRNTNQHLSGQNETGRNGRQESGAFEHSAYSRWLQKKDLFGLAAFVRHCARPQTLV